MSRQARDGVPAGLGMLPGCGRRPGRPLPAEIGFGGMVWPLDRSVRLIAAAGQWFIEVIYVIPMI